MPKGLWTKELIKTLWEIRTTPIRVRGFSPFKLPFGDKAMTPGKLTARSLRAQEKQVLAVCEVYLDFLEEDMLHAIATMMRYMKGSTLRRTTRSCCDP